MEREDKNKEPLTNEAEPVEEPCSPAAEDESVCRCEETASPEDCCCSSSTEALEWKERLREAEQKRDEYLSMAQRIQADFDNFRRRNKAAVADAYKSAAADVVESFLPVLDNLERALASAVDAGAQESMVKGIEMVLRQFMDCFSKLDVEEIEALGQPFDPEIHNAVMQVDAEEGQEPNTVTEVLQKGYRLKDKVIRYSMVKVAR